MLKKGNYEAIGNLQEGRGQCRKPSMKGWVWIISYGRLRPYNLCLCLNVAGTMIKCLSTGAIHCNIAGGLLQWFDCMYTIQVI